MYIVNTGSMEFRGDANTVEKLLAKHHLNENEISVDCEKNEIYIEEAHGDIDDDIRDFLSDAKNAGITVNGQYTYYGDYEGNVYINDNNLETIDIEDTSLYEATDEDLVNILKNRGYEVTITKKEE